MVNKRRQRANSFSRIYSEPAHPIAAIGEPEIDPGGDEYDFAAEGPQPGTEMGDFTVLEHLGGEQAAVIKVRHTTDGRIFALRVPLDQLPEARLQAGVDRTRTLGINDGSIPRTLGIANLPGGLFGVLYEFVSGEDPLRYADKRALTVHGRLRLFCRLCRSARGLNRQNLVHCDIKPDNALVRPSGRACLVDLGGLADVGTVVALNHPGTAGYRAPERDVGDWIVHASVDVFSLGVILYTRISQIDCLALARDLR